MTKEDIQGLLADVLIPQSDKTLSDPNTLKNLAVRDNQVQLTLVLPANMKELEKSTLNLLCQKAILEKYPEADIHIHFERGEAVASRAVPKHTNLKNIIAVASGKGGVGKSTVSTYLALGLKNLGYRVGLMDADLYGPSIPTMLGLEGQRPKVVKHEGRPVIVPLEKDGLFVISIGNIVEPQQAVILRGPRLGAIIKQFFNETLWPELDYLVVDLPPGTGDIQLTLVQTASVTGAVIVTTPQTVAIRDAVKAMNMFKLSNIDVPVLGVIENMSWFSPEELPDNKYFLFGEGGGDLLAKMGETDLLGQIPLIEGVRAGGDEGKPVDVNHPARPYFDQMAQNVHVATEKRNKQRGATRVVKIERTS